VGLILWGAAALLAALAVWGLRLEDWGVALGPARGWLQLCVVVGCAASGLGAIALVCPHDAMPRQGCWLALCGVALYAPLTYLLWRMHAGPDALGGPAYGYGISTPPSRTLLRIAIAAIMGAILLCLRANARLLAARSFLMRTGRVDRQTMAALLAVLGVAIAGDLLVLSARLSTGPLGDQLRIAGQVVILAGSVLFTLGLASILIDVWRLAGVILEPPLTIAQVIGREARPGTRVSGPPPENARSQAHGA
jgi:hypothetical protein